MLWSAPTTRYPTLGYMRWNHSPRVVQWTMVHWFISYTTTDRTTYLQLVLYTQKNTHIMGAVTGFLVFEDVTAIKFFICCMGN